MTTEKKQLNWTNILFFTLTPLSVLILLPIAIWLHGVSWGMVLFFLVTYSLSNLSITAGYHRYFSHRSFDAHPVVEFLFMLIGSGAFQGSVLEWATDHRRHHRAVDTDNDPYSIKKGFWHAHMGWLMYKDSPESRESFAPDLAKKAILRFQDKHYALIATAVGFGLPLVIGYLLGWGWTGIVWGGALRIVCSNHSTFFINSLCHYVGRQPYSDKHSARDSVLMAFLTFGEGYHNYHHEFQIDYRNGIRWYQWDPTKWTIKFLAFCGLAKRLRQVPATEIMKARIAMQEKLMLARGASSERLEQMRAKIEEAQQRFRQLTDECVRLQASLKEVRRMRDQMQESTRQRYLQMKAELEMSKLELQASYDQWRVYFNAVSAMASR